MRFLQFVARSGKRNDIGVAQVVELVDLFTEPGECHAVEMIVGDDERRTHPAGRFKSSRSVLKSDDVIPGWGRDLLDHPPNRRTAVDYEYGRRHLSLQFY